MGASTLEATSRGHEIAAALEADTLDNVETQRGRELRIFAENRDNDLLALAAIKRARGSGADPTRLAETDRPVLDFVAREGL